MPMLISPPFVTARNALVCRQFDASGLTKLGNMTAGGGLASGFNGVTTESYGNGPQYNANSGARIGIDLGASVEKICCKYQVYIISGAKIDGGAGTETITELDLHASTDNFSGSDETIHAPANQTNDSDNQLFDIQVTDKSTAYRYWAVDISHGGGAETHIAEVVFWFIEQ
jgi:hypothetical protein